MFAPLLVAATTAAAAPYELDGITLGSKIGDLIAHRGKPARESATSHLWETKGGGSVVVLTDETGAIVVVDVTAGPQEHRAIDLPFGPLLLGGSGHVNYGPPLREAEFCGAGLIGEPCLTYALDPDTTLVTNFAGDPTLADGPLSEVILGKRKTLLQIGRLVESAPSP